MLFAESLCYTSERREACLLSSRYFVFLVVSFEPSQLRPHKGFKFTMVYTSPVCRVNDTARALPFRQSVGGCISHQVDTSLHKLLRGLPKEYPHLGYYTTGLDP